MVHLVPESAFTTKQQVELAIDCNEITYHGSVLADLLLELRERDRVLHYRTFRGTNHLGARPLQKDTDYCLGS